MRLKPKDLRGALKKYFDVEEKKNWMNEQMLEDIKDDDSEFSF